MNEHGNKGKQNAMKGETPLDSRIFSRCLSSDKGAWVRAAISKQMKLSEWIQATLNDAVKK